MGHPTFAGALLAVVTITSCLRPSVAQDLSVVSFTASEGLPTNLTKYSHQDETGFIWIATDAGLVRFDGATFRNFTKADGLPDNYVKSIFGDGRGTTYVVTDRGVATTGRGRTPEFHRFLNGTTSPVDSVLFYPKSVYEDQQGDVWITDARGLIRIRGGGIRRFQFPEESWPDSFSRTYVLAEDQQGHLVAASERGHLFLYDRSWEEFRPISDGRRMVSQISAVLRNPDGSLWYGGADGIHSLRLTPEGKVDHWSRVSDIAAVSHLLRSPQDDVLVGTTEHGLQILKAAEGYSRAEQYARLSSTVVNHLAYDREGNLLVCTDNGFAIIKRQFFSLVVNFSNSAIETLTRDPGGRIYGVRDHEVFEIVTGDDPASERTLFTTSEGLTSLAADGNRIWAGSRNGSIYLHRDGHTRRIPTRTRLAIHTMSAGTNGDIWAASVNGSEIIRISSDGSPTYYGPAEGVVSPINVVTYLQDELFAGSEGDTFLLKYIPGKDRFSNISPKLRFEPRSDIQIFDIDILSPGKFWLASNEGLLSYSSDGVDHFDSDMQLQNEEIRALAHDSLGNVWVGTGRGLYRIFEGQVSHFHRDPGLANTTMSMRSLVIDNEQRLWVGHFGGISMWSGIPGEVLVTPRPVWLELLVDDELRPPESAESPIPYGSYVEVRFLSLSHPGDNVRYQIRSLGGDDGDWSVPTTNRVFAITQATERLQGIEVRAQQDGYLWSAPATMELTVSVPWYRKWWAILIILAVSGAVLYVMMESHNQIRTRQLKAQTRELEEKVRERTTELMVQKSMIEQANIDLKKALERNHEFIGIAAHDLRNPLTSLAGFSELLIDSLGTADPADFQAKAEEVLPIIRRAATAMQGIIQDMLDSQLVEGGGDCLNPEDTNLTQLAHTVINMNASAARRKAITIRFSPQGIFRAHVDARSMQRVLDNLVSNAVKYSPHSSRVDVMMMHVNDAIRISVKDQGPGLTLEDRERVFGKLQRLSARPTGGESSTGLGLYIVRSIVTLHRGRVGVDSEPGEGAEFWVEIPIVGVRAAA